MTRISARETFFMKRICPLRFGAVMLVPVIFGLIVKPGRTLRGSR